MELHRELCFFNDPVSGENPQYRQDDRTLPGKGNYHHNRVVVPIKDVRSSEERFEIDKHSFAILPNAFTPNPNIDFSNAEVVSICYIPAMEELILRNVPGAEKVIAYDVTTRKASKTKVANRQVNKLHVDVSPKGAFTRAERHLSIEDFAAVKAGTCRLRIINVWKPINGPVKDHPLVFADHRSIHQEDLIPVTHIYSDYTGETAALRYRPGQEFWYWSDMDVEDVILFQCFDSMSRTSPGGTQHCQCVHGSFELDDNGNESYCRESIELRCIVLG